MIVANLQLIWGMSDEENNYPDAAADLKDQDRVTDPNRDDYRGISVENFHEFQDKHPVATIVIIQHLVDPSAMIGQGIAQEILMDNIPFNESDGHLVRSPGPCHFCVNKSWTFPEGCAYGKDKEAPAAPDAQNRVVEYVLQRLEDAVDD